MGSKTITKPHNELSNTKVTVDLVGQVNLTLVTIGDKDTKGLLDSGSQVTTVSKSYYDNHLSDFPLLPLSEILEVEVAGGDKLGYFGVVELDLQFTESGDKQIYATPVLVVKDTSFNSKVPFIIGKNVIQPCLKRCKEIGGDRYQQRLTLSDSWRLALQCASAQEKCSHLDNLGVLQCTKQVIVPSNQSVIVHGLGRLEGCRKTSVITEGSSTLPCGLAVVPTLQQVETNEKSYSRIGVSIHNLTPHDVTLPAKTTLCSIHQVSLVTGSQVQTDVGNTQVLDQFNINESLTSEQKNQVISLLSKFQHIFSTGDTDIGRTKKVKHEIKLKDPTPVRQPHRRIPPNMYDEVRKHINEMLNAGIIRESHSSFASPIVLVRKPDGSLRFCIDYRQLNKNTVRDAHTLPRLTETFDSLDGSKWFTTLDLKAGYWQVEVQESDKYKTAFTAGPLGFYEFNTMPFGLVNAPATFQRLMQATMGDLHLSQCLLYLDDIIVFSRSFQDHLVRLERVLQRLADAGLKLKPSKCHLFQRETKYLGHIISQDGIKTDPSKIEVLQNWPVPENIKDVRRFLGFAGFYRRFIRDFAKIAKPLHELLKGQPTKTCKGKGVHSTKVIPPKFEWKDIHQNAFNHLIRALGSSEVLAFADFKRPFTLQIDASGIGLGAVLLQEHNGQDRPVAYASRGLSLAESRYPAHKLEFLSLKWAITDKFKEYLYNSSFTVKTDNNPLTYVLTSARLDAVGQRWVSELANYNFSLQYKSGHSNIAADALSRIPRSIHSDGTYDHIPPEAVNAICNQQVFCYAQSVALGEEAVHLMDIPHTRIPEITNEHMARAQENDKFISPVLKHMRSKKKKFQSQNTYFETNILSKMIDNLILKDNVLYRKRIVDEEIKYQLVLPHCFRRRALHGVHDEVGHLGRERTLALLQDRFYWPRMSKDTAEYVKRCSPCICRKTPTNQHAPLVSILTSQPLELLCTDFLKLEPSEGGVQDILVITDHFTRFAQAIPCSSQSAKATAKALYDTFICHYGFPLRLHSDQGRNFESSIIQELCKLCGIEKSRSTPYHAQGNGACERFNRTLLSMLGTLPPLSKQNWKDHVKTVVHAYNCTRNDVTKFSPFMLMFGREPRLPVDILLGVNQENNGKNYGKYVSDLREKLEAAYKIAQLNSKKDKTRHKEHYDLKTRGAVISPGDRVLVRNVSIRGKNKLADKWEKIPYLVIEQPSKGIPVFKVKHENGTGGIRTLHRNLLLPIGNIPIETSSSEQLSVNESVDKVNNEDSDNEVVISDNESDNEFIVMNDTGQHKDQGLNETNIPNQIDNEMPDAQDDERIIPPVDRDNNVESEPEVVPQETETQSYHGDSDHDTTNETVDSPTPSSPRQSRRVRRPPVRYPENEWIYDGRGSHMYQILNV